MEPLPFAPGELEATYQPRSRRRRSRRPALTVVPNHEKAPEVRPIEGALPLSSIVDALIADQRLVHHQVIPARPGTGGQLNTPLPAELQRCLPDGGLWKHQADAINLIRSGESVAVATGTASGKSLCYQLPIAESILTGLRASTALLLYPTKALAHDQLRAFTDLGVPGLLGASYDGDTDADQRRWVRNNANVILTNPEMLHNGIVPQHRRWATFFKRLEFVVIDELHVLRGIFGTHVSHLLRRLQRVAALYGAEPKFIFTSATIGDPSVLASELTGGPVVQVDADHSPRGARTVALVQPATLDPEKGRRQSPATEAIRLGAELVAAGRRAIVFCPSRAMTERVAAGITRAVDPEFADTIRPYRSGYLASERREIEEELATGRVRLVVATSALELGVDIGGLDATVLCGFPGTIASMWQQIGRAGRANEESLAVIIAGENQMDQWFVKNPTQLFERPPEPAVINVTNPHIMDPHLCCAAYESPLIPLDSSWWEGLDDGIRRMVASDQLGIRSDDTRLPQAFWDGRGVPFSKIGLRSASGGEVKIVNVDGTPVGTVEKSRAPSLVHTGAMYLHRGRNYRVIELDLDTRRAVVEPDDSGSWTSARSSVDIESTHVMQRRQLGRAHVHFGMVQVTSTVTGYQEFQNSGPDAQRSKGEVIELDFEPQTLETTSVWWEWDQSVITQAGVRDFAVPGALHAAEHAAIGMLPLFAICDRWDVGGVSIAQSSQTGLATVFIYDGYPGGAGISDLAFARAEELLSATADLLEQCTCTTGCPSCVQSPKCGNGNEPLDRWGALGLLRATLGDADPF
ncbi:MAG: DEAD/DEAH box helicase [Acidimicrobiales bacterium]